MIHRTVVKAYGGPGTRGLDHQAAKAIVQSIRLDATRDWSRWGIVLGCNTEPMEMKLGRNGSRLC